MQLEFPGTYAPAPPAVSIVLPDDWRPLIAPGSLIAAVKQTVGSTFVANVIVTWVRESVEFRLDEAAAALDAELRAQPEAAMLEPVEAEFDGLRGVGRAAAFNQPDVGAVAQFHIMFLVPGEGLSDLVHVTSTLGGDRVDQDFPEVRQILRSVEVRPVTSTSR